VGEEHQSEEDVIEVEEAAWVEAAQRCVVVLKATVNENDNSVPAQTCN
jgi:hypothetical protein